MTDSTRLGEGWNWIGDNTYDWGTGAESPSSAWVERDSIMYAWGDGHLVVMVPQIREQVETVTAGLLFRRQEVVGRSYLIDTEAIRLGDMTFSQAKRYVPANHARILAKIVETKGEPTEVPISCGYTTPVFSTPELVQGWCQSRKR